MMGEAKHETREVFVAAVALNTAGERARYLEDACRDKPELRARVEELLSSYEPARDFLQRDALGGDLQSEEAPFTESPGTLIGRYKLLEEIGEGGFGVVYMAEQLEPIRRRVALKIIKPGMDTKQVIARFEAERQALGLMNHPNIAHVLDAGATESGRPYFVMELVQGVSITRFCDANLLTPPGRLKLFMAVCDAVQHAHQKGIIHRDLKPSNILVTLHDGKAVPKVIDFGTAKALQHPLTEKTLFTAYGRLIGTPQYMSPEQAELSGLDVDTRADIYSLGVLMYELLTGTTPFEAERLRSAAFEEMLRIIRQEGPPRPSTRVSTLGARATEIASHRRLDPAMLRRMLHGDLDWIVMKCLEKERARRYETVNALAHDVQRHLDNEPIAARPPSRLYRLSKLVRRNKAVFAAGSAIALAVVAGLAATSWSLFEEKKALERAVAAERAAETARVNEMKLRRKAEANEQRANLEASKSEQVANFLGEMLQGVDPEVALGRDTELLRSILDRTAEHVGQDLDDQPEVAAQLLSIIAGAYGRLSLFDEAEAMEREALRLRTSIFGETNELVAASLNNLAQLLVNRRGAKDFANAEILARRGLAIRRHLLGNEHLEVGNSLATLAAALQNQRKYAEAEKAHLEALAIQRRFLNQRPALANALGNLGLLYRDSGRLKEAQATLTEALELRRKLVGDEHPATAYLLRNLASVAAKAGNLQEAESLLREALPVQRKLLPAEHKLVALTLGDLADVLHRQGRLVEAEALAREALAIRRNILAADNPDLLFSISALADILRTQGRLNEAEQLEREVLPAQEGF